MRVKEKLSLIKSITKEYGFVFGCKYAFYLKTKQYRKYIQLVYNYLLRFYNSDIQIYNSAPSKKKNNGLGVKNVFVCWWQGYDNMPDLCKSCFKKLKSALNQKFNLVFVTKDNYKEYVVIPTFVIEKMENGIIPVTQFSDILRQGLIAQNGGIWIDSTIWTNDGINKYIDQIGEFWSVGLETIYNEKVIGQLISSCKWSSFIIGGIKGSRFFNISFDLMCKFYEKHNTPIDYFLQNLVFKLVFEKIDCCKDMLSKVVPSNPNLYELKNIFNERFDDEKYASLNRNTSFFKLTYKANYKMKADEDITYYGFVMEYLTK